MTESTLKADLVKKARAILKGWEILRHEDRFTHGIPDITFTGLKRTSWWEAKYATPGFKVKGIQELKTRRLALAGLAFFVVYWEVAGEKRTYIVDPCNIRDDISSWKRFTVGFNHEWVIGFIKEAHGNNH